MRIVKVYFLEISVFLLTSIILLIVQLKVENPMLLLERFFKGWGWAEILFIAIYASLVANRMRDSNKSSQTRKLTWAFFSIIFFGQLLLGLLGFDIFFMSAGKIHFPIPAFIISGSIINFKIGFMPILFLSTIILSGPSWCSHLCYFGSFDNLSAGKNTLTKQLLHKEKIRITVFFVIVGSAILIRIFDVDIKVTLILASTFAFISVLVILLYSRKQRIMVHCASFCPIGLLTSYLKYISPFRMYIDTNLCDRCNSCTRFCKYDALNKIDIIKGKPGISCTYCGDCISACHSNSIKYKFFGVSSKNARLLYIFISVSLHAVFLALARI